MFKNLKDKLATQVTKTNQTLFSTILSNDSGSSSRDSANRTSSISSRDENHENNRSRLDSASSDISQITNYISPSRQYMPPSDIESEYGDDIDHDANLKMQKLLNIYKNKFNQLKNAYDEIEREKDNLKNVLQKTQDKSIRSSEELRERIKAERQAREELQLCKNQLEQLKVQNDSSDSNQDELRILREKNTKLEGLLIKCKEKIKAHQEKQVELIREHDDLVQQLNEKQTFIESLMEANSKEEEHFTLKSFVKHFLDRPQENSTVEVKEHFTSDITGLLNDKQRLQEELEAARICIQQFQTDLDLAKKQQQQINEDFKQKYENLLKDNEQVEIIKQNLMKEKEQNLKSYDILKIEYENLINELQQTKQAKDDIQSLLDQTIVQQKIEQIKYEQIQQQEPADSEIDQLKSTLSKLQHDYGESLSINTQLTQTIDTQRQEFSTLQTELNNKLKELQQENMRMTSQLEIDHQEAIDSLKIEFENERKTIENKIQDLSLQLNQRQEEINRLQQLSHEQKTQYEKELNDRQNSFQEDFDLTSKKLKTELDEKTSYIQNVEQQLEEKQNEIDHLNTTNKELEQFQATMENSQKDGQKLLEERDKTIDTLKQDHQLEIEKLNKQHENLSQQLNEKYTQLEIRLNNILAEKSEVENQLDSIRQERQTMESDLNDKTNDYKIQLEQTSKEFESERTSHRNEIETLKSEIISLINLNEEKTRQIDEYDNDKFNFEQEINERNRQITESNEKIQQLEINLEQTKESNAKLRKALQQMKESVTNNQQSNSQDIENRLRKITEEYEQRLQDQEFEYDLKLKDMAKAMNTQIDEKEQNYNRQLQDYIQRTRKTEDGLIHDTEKKIHDAEQRAFITEKHLSKLEEDLKEKQLEHYHIVRDLQIQIEKLTAEKPSTTEDFSQTEIEDLNRSGDNQHSLVFEPTEVDYLRQIVLAYMTGTDRLTMAKVICAVLHFTETQTTAVVEQEKLRQSRWLNSPR